MVPVTRGRDRRTIAARAGTIATMPKQAAAPKPSSTKPRKGRALHDALDDIRLTGDRVVVEHPDAGERTTRGGLLIPATAVPAPKRCVWGEVLLVGPDVRAVKANDRILYLPQAGLEVELDGRECLLLRERDVQAVSSSPEGTERQPGQYL
jgi:chaperonin GroES